MLVALAFRSAHEALGVKNYFKTLPSLSGVLRLAMAPQTISLSPLYLCLTYRCLSPVQVKIKARFLKEFGHFKRDLVRFLGPQV